MDHAVFTRFVAENQRFIDMIDAALGYSRNFPKTRYAPQASYGPDQIRGLPEGAVALSG